MPRTIALDEQNFEKLRRENLFYVDKTDFIRQWWDGRAHATLITRPHGF